jgi:hypothetical protein
MEGPTLVMTSARHEHEHPNVSLGYALVLGPGDIVTGHLIDGKPTP